MNILRFGSRKTKQVCRYRRQLCLELLEGRCVPSTVTNLTDHDPGSLRDAIGTTPPGGIIDFYPGLMGTITLTTGSLSITNNVTIAGPGGSVIAVSGNQTFQVFNISQTVTAMISGLTIANGNFSTGNGGGINNAGTLTVTNCTLSKNAGVDGGGIYNSGWLTVSNSLLDGNVAGNNGGNICNTFGGYSAGILTVANCTFSGGFANYGGGIYNTNGLTATNCTFTNNTASTDGGAICNTLRDGYIAGTLTITGCDFAKDSATAGGGVYNSSDGTSGLGSQTLTECTFSNENASDGGGVYNSGNLALMNCTLTKDTATDSGGGGGGICNTFGGTLTLASCMLAGNSAAVFGGAIFNNRISTLTATGCTFTGNSATLGGGAENDNGSTLTVGQTSFVSNSANDGGGLYNGAALTVTACTLSSNVGGGIANFSILTVTGSTFIGNSARDGGGIFNLSGLLTITNSTLTQNQATTTSSEGGGGGIYTVGMEAKATIINCTVTGNTAVNQGGGISSDRDTLILGNTLIARNSAPLGPDILGIATSQGHNLVGDGGGSNGLVNGLNGDQVGNHASPIDPRLAPLQDNGGPTQTIALLLGSPAIDAGDNSLAVDASGNALATDQRGFTRIVNGTIDIGAFEDQVVSTAPTGPQTAVEGSAQSFALGSFTDQAPPSSYTITILWGDGGPNRTVTAASQGTILNQAHAYAEEGGYTATVQVSDAEGDTRQQTFTVNVLDPAVTGAAVNFSLTAGSAFGGRVATFADPGVAEAADGTHYSASISWGDNTTPTAGIISFAGGTFTISGVHTYASAGSYPVASTINHESVITLVQGMATVNSLGQFVPMQMVKPISFWEGLTGQQLIRRFGLTAGGQTLGQWLATTLPNLYGGSNGAPNLSPFTNAQIGTYYQSLFLVSKGTGLDAELLATALEVFATTASLGGTVAQGDGFLVDGNGLGAYSWNIGANGRAFGVPNFTILNVYQILLAANNAAVAGEAWGADTFLRNEGLSVSRAINGG
ncbi:MAG TPA: choice-of-anchor Q domain-containing protein [Gemmataceae bacterium]|nr:choice-of-anchor Q domain-containing protein [Gemmataceae bacterium]